MLTPEEYSSNKLQSLIQDAKNKLELCKKGFLHKYEYDDLKTKFIEYGMSINPKHLNAQKYKKLMDTIQRKPDSGKLYTNCSAIESIVNFLNIISELEKTDKNK